jgi:4-hydroxy-tetrahydrodipicolinate synthase
MTLSGLFAAVTTPVTESGALDLATFDRHLELLIDAGVDGVCLGGATAEYPHSELHDRKVLIARAARRLPDELTLLTAIGAPNVRHVIDLGKYALDQGSQAVLLPMPMFFRYQQQDLAEYCREVAQSLAAPCLIYDLPDFTNPIDPATVIELLEQEEHIVGLKDSSGRPERQSRYAEARGDSDWSLLVGDDSRLKDGLTVGWDGGVSGIAALCPELMVAAVKAGKAGDAAELERLQGLIDDLIAQITGLPVPWGLRIGLEARGLPTGPLPYPVSAGRREHAARLQAWLPSWLQQVGAADWTRVPSV